MDVYIIALHCMLSVYMSSERQIEMKLFSSFLLLVVTMES